MKKKLLVYGAGAIGRGYLPWVFSPSSYAFYFVEANESLRASLRAKKRFITYCSKNGAYEPLDVSVEGCCAPGEELAWLSEADAVITAVGPRNFLALRDRFHLGNFKNREVPVICCENDAQLPKVMEELTGNPNIFFAIPDVITSNTAPDRKSTRLNSSH